MRYFEVINYYFSPNIFLVNNITVPKELQKCLKLLITISTLLNAQFHSLLLHYLFLSECKYLFALGNIHSLFPLITHINDITWHFSTDVFYVLVLKCFSERIVASLCWVLWNCVYILYYFRVLGHTQWCSGTTSVSALIN